MISQDIDNLPLREGSWEVHGFNLPVRTQSYNQSYNSERTSEKLNDLVVDLGTV